MKLKRFIALLLAFALCLFAFGCEVIPSEADKSNLGTQVDVSGADEEQIHIRDKSLLYEMYEATEVVTMYLTVSVGNAAENTNHTWEEINTYSAYDYESWGVPRYQVAGLLQVGNEEGLVEGELGYGQVAPNCTVQIRGQSSSLNVQKNYKIKIKENKGSWRGQTTIALNKHQGDGLRFRNKLGFDLLSGVEELMSLRTTFVHLYVKDTTAGGEAKFEDYGLYTQVEQLNKTALETHGLDKRGHLYKINVCEFYRYEDVIRMKDDPLYDVTAFEQILEIKGDDDHSKLIALLEKINDYSIPMETILEEHFDMENIAYWMAFQLMLGNVDTQSRNFYLYSPLNSDRWYILAWDLDGMLKRSEWEIQERYDYAEWERGISNYWGNILFRRCLKSEAYLAALDAAVEDLRGYLSAERVEALTEAYAEVVKPYLYTGRDLLYAPLTAKEYDTVLASVMTMIEDNYRFYKESFDNPMPFFIVAPKKAEGGRISLEWDTSYDLDAEAITYTVEVANEYTFASPIFKAEGLRLPMAEIDGLAAGQYFIRVRATNESGNSQYAFDTYTTEQGKVYGTMCFYVDAKGDIVEDVYVEG